MPPGLPGPMHFIQFTRVILAARVDRITVGRRSTGGENKAYVRENKIGLGKWRKRFLAGG